MCGLILTRNVHCQSFVPFGSPHVSRGARLRVNAEYVFVESAYRGLDTPTVKEFPLTLQRCNQLVWNIGEIKLAVDAHVDDKESQLMQQLGGNHYVHVNCGFKVVDLRRFWLPDGKSEIRATRKEIALKFDEFRKLTILLPDNEKTVPELTDIQPCYMRSDHFNELGTLSCFVCNPSGAYEYYIPVPLEMCGTFKTGTWKALRDVVRE